MPAEDGQTRRARVRDRTPVVRLSIGYAVTVHYDPRQHHRTTLAGVTPRMVRLALAPAVWALLFAAAVWLVVVVLPSPVVQGRPTP